jgi:hypothetical protein
VPTWNVYTVYGSPAGFLTPSAAGKNPKSENEVICDPIQGNVADCCLLAALGSCAWNNSVTNIPITQADNFALSFTIIFWWYDRALPLNPATMIATPKTVSNTLFIDGSKPVYAQPTPQNEIWVAIYEKAFAVFAGCPLDANGNPDISKLTTPPIDLKPSSALGVLVNLTKKKFSFTTAYPPQTAFETINVPPSPFNGQPCQDYFDIIKTVCTPNAASPSSGKTKYPMVAWTYDSENYLPQEWKDKGLKYRYTTTNLDRMLVAKHTYSILGYYTSGGNKYIVLRDPLGKWGTKTPQEDPVIKSYLPPAPSNWDPVQDHLKFPIRDISPCPCGVFGLRVDAFKGCFKGFGWVQ